MTSIFNTYYADNNERVNARGRDQKTEGKSENKQAGEFAKILGDFEKKPESLEKTALLDPSQVNKNSIGAKFSKHAEAEKLHPQIVDLTRGSAQDACLLTSPESAITSAQQAAGLYRGVKFPAPGVSGPDDTQLLKAPLAPTVLSVSRGERSEQAPAMPSLASAVRVDGTGAVPIKTEQYAKVPPVGPLAADPLARASLAIDPDKITSLLKSGLPRAATERPKESEATVKLASLRRLVADVGREHGIDPNLTLAIAQAESDFRPHAVSMDGHASKGLFQLLDSTGRGMLEYSGLDEPYKPFDPKQNATLGIQYLRKLHDIFSEETILSSRTKTMPVRSADDLEKLAIAAFNAGEGSVARAQAKALAEGKNPADFEAVKKYLPASTRSYVQKVTSFRAALAVDASEDELA